MIGLLVTFVVVVLVALMPLGLRVRYDAYGPFAAALIGPFKLCLYPRQPKEKRPKVQKEKTGKSAAKKEKGGSVSDFLPILRMIIDFLEGFRTKLTINDLRLVLILGGGDPCDLALNYGKGWAALGSIMPLLERFFMIKKRNLEVQCDFTADKTIIIAGADLTIRLWQLIMLLSTHGLKIVKEYLRIMKIRKGGAKT